MKWTLGPVLGVLFTGLKLSGYIDWSWWWVLLPFYVELMMAGAVLVVAFLIVCGCGMVKAVRDARKEQELMRTRDDLTDS